MLEIRVASTAVGDVLIVTQHVLGFLSTKTDNFIYVRAHGQDEWLGAYNQLGEALLFLHRGGPAYYVSPSDVTDRLRKADPRPIIVSVEHVGRLGKRTIKKHTLDEVVSDLPTLQLLLADGGREWLGWRVETDRTEEEELSALERAYRPYAKKVWDKSMLVAAQEEAGGEDEWSRSHRAECRRAIYDKAMRDVEAYKERSSK